MGCHTYGRCASLFVFVPADAAQGCARLRARAMASSGATGKALTYLLNVVKVLMGECVNVGQDAYGSQDRGYSKIEGRWSS